jgi:hypothetical protein
MPFDCGREEGCERRRRKGVNLFGDLGGKAFGELLAQQVQVLLVHATKGTVAHAALEVQLLLHLIATCVRDLVTKATELHEVTAQSPLGYASTFGQLERVKPRLGDDDREYPQKASEPAGSIHPAEAVLADFFPGSGIALKRVGFGLFLVSHFLVEPAGDHLVRHGLGNAELGERLHLVGHDLVSRSLNGSENLFDGRGLLGHWLLMIPKPTRSQPRLRLVITDCRNGGDAQSGD